MTPRSNKRWQLKLLYCLYPFFLFSCGNTHESIATLGDYDIPMNDSISELVYTYVSDLYSDTTTIRYVFSPQEEGLQIAQYNEVGGEPTFERHYTIADGRKTLLEEFYYDYPSETAIQAERLPGDIRTFREIDDGNKFSALEIEIAFTNSIEFRTIFKEINTYEHDTVLLWNNKSAEAIKFHTEMATRTFLKYVPFRSDRTEYSYNTYYAKGIGMVKSKKVYWDEVETTDLVGIEMFWKSMENGLEIVHDSTLHVGL